jgi:hypothetical protein
MFQQANAGDFIYVFYGTLDVEGRQAMAPKGEFFTKYRETWMPEVPGMYHGSMKWGFAETDGKIRFVPEE